jgi:hypothetical protein
MHTARQTAVARSAGALVERAAELGGRIAVAVAVTI